MPTSKKKVVSKGAKRGPKIKEDKKKPVQVYMLESEIMAIGKYIDKGNKTYADCIEAVRDFVLYELTNHAALEP